MSRASAYILLFSVSLLAGLGMVMLASTSFFLEDAGGEGYAMLRTQGMWLVLSAVAAGVLAFLNYSWLYRARWWIYGIAVFGLVLCFVPFVGVEVNGAARWVSLKAIGLPQLQYQASELGKLACAIILASWFARFEPQTREFLGGFVYPGCLAMVIIGLVAMEVDLGTAALIGSLTVSTMFVAGVRLFHLVPLILGGVAALVFIVTMMPNRMERIMAFQDLEANKSGFGLQQWRALLAFGSGGLEGAGLGNGRMKMNYLPEAETDFIFPVLGEEMGFYGTVFVVALYIFILISGISIARRAPDRFSRLLAFGITFTLALEAFINMGVTTALLPNKGLPLPFVSKGGSSLFFAMVGIGILVNIHRNTGLSRKNDLMLSKRSGMPVESHGLL